MATVNYSVPDAVKEAFNAAFVGQNKSAVITGLMTEAVERRAQARRRARAVEELLKLVDQAPRVSDELIRKARASGRP